MAEETTTYAELLDRIDAFARELSAREQLGLLHTLIAPLLGRLELVDDVFTDEPQLTAPEAIREFRRAASGEPADLDAVHDQLTTLALCYSEDQDPDLHVLSQSAYAAATWLRLLAGRELRASVFDGEAGGEAGEDGELIPAFAPSTFSRVVDLLAWTRSGQMYLFWEDAEEDPRLGSLPDALRELHGMHAQLTG